MDEEQQRQFNENLKLLNDMIPNLVSAMQTQTKAITDSIATQNISTRAEKDSTKATVDDTIATKENIVGKKALTEAQKFEIESTKKLTQTKENLSKAGESAKTGLQQFGKSLLDTSTGFNKYSGALGSLGDAASSVFKNFGMLGTGLSIVTQGATKLSQAFLEQTDNALKFKDELSKLGAVGVGTARDLQSLATASGFTVAEFQKLMKPIASIGSGLVNLGTTAGEGAKNFLEITKVTDETRAKFQRLGLSQEELAQSQADYIRLQQISGRSLMLQGRSAEQLRRESLAYTENLTVLAQLTGKNVEQIKKEQEAALQREETLIQTSLMEMEINRLKSTNSDQDKERAALLEKELVARNDLLKSITSQVGDENLSNAMSKFLATGAITQESAFLKRIGVPLEEFAVRIKNGENVTGEFLNSLKQNADATLKQVGTAAMLDSEVRKQFGLTKEVLQFMAGRRGVNETLAAEEARRKTTEQATKGTDAAADSRAKLTEVEIKAKTSLDNLTASINPLLKDFPALHNALDIFKKSIEGLDNILKNVINGFSSLNMGAIAIGSAAFVAASALSKIAMGGTGGIAGGIAGGGVLGRAGRIAGQVAGRLALPLAAGGAAYGAYQGYTADESASFGQKLLNAGSSALNFTTMGLLGSSREEIINRGTKPQSQGIEGEFGAPNAGFYQFSDSKVILDDIFEFGSRSGSKSSFEGLEDTFQKAVERAALEYNIVTGKKIQINSAKRDSLDQQRLWDESVRAGRPGIGPTGMAIARPGTSLHERGHAIDIQQYMDPIAISAFNKQGLYQKVPNDPVHFQARNGALMDGPNSGYPVNIMAHGKEAIVPLPSNTVIEKLSKMTMTELNNSDSVNKTIFNETNNDLSNLLAVNMELKNIMDTKLSAMLDKLDTSVNIQDKLYKNTI